MNEGRIISKNLLCVFAILTGLIFNFSVATAALWRVDATSTIPTSYSDFWILFDDTGTPGTVGVEDLVSWSGFSQSNDPEPWINYDILTKIPSLTIDGLTLVETDSEWEDYWEFDQTPSNTFSLYLISHDYDANVVPIPGAVWMLGSGLIALVGLRRRLKK